MKIWDTKWRNEWVPAKNYKPYLTKATLHLYDGDSESGKPRYSAEMQIKEDSSKADEYLILRTYDGLSFCGAIRNGINYIENPVYLIELEWNDEGTIHFQRTFIPLRDPFIKSIGWYTWELKFTTDRGTKFTEESARYLKLAEADNDKKRSSRIKSLQSQQARSAEGSEQITLADKTLEDFVKYTLGLSQDDVITQDDADNIESLDCSAIGFESLEGIEHFRNLQTLSLEGNEITDIAPLTKLLFICNMST